MKGFLRIGVALSATVGFSALVGTQAAGAATKSYLGDYEALNQTVTSLTLDFTVPHYKCTNDQDNVSMYANTFDDNGGGQDAFDGAFVDLSCNTKDKPFIYPSLEIDGTYSQATGVTIKRGDAIEISVTCGASGGAATLDDETSGLSASLPTPSGSSCNGVFMGNIGSSNEAGTKILPLPTFKSIDFSNATVNTAPLGDASPAAVAVNYYEGKKNVITVGPLTDGTAWVNTQGS